MYTEDQFIEEMGLYFDEQGVPRMAGRMLAWLLICDPPEQTMPAICARLGASKGSVSTMARILTRFELIERISHPGIRADFYRIAPDFPDKVMAGGGKKFADLRRITARGLLLRAGNGNLPPPDSPIADDRAAADGRLRELHDLYLFLEELFPALLEEWHALRGRKES